MDLTQLSQPLPCVQTLPLVWRRSNAEIAALLYLGESTIKRHVASILDKLRVRDRLRAPGYWPRMVSRLSRWSREARSFARLNWVRMSEPTSLRASRRFSRLEVATKRS